MYAPGLRKLGIPIMMVNLHGTRAKDASHDGPNGVQKNAQQLDRSGDQCHVHIWLDGSVVQADMASSIGALSDL